MGGGPVQCNHPGSKVGGLDICACSYPRLDLRMPSVRLAMCLPVPGNDSALGPAPPLVWTKRASWRRVRLPIMRPADVQIGGYRHQSFFFPLFLISLPCPCPTSMAHFRARGREIRRDMVDSSHTQRRQPSSNATR